jgi:hypothetical protein
MKGIEWDARGGNETHLEDDMYRAGTPQDESLNTRRGFDARNRYSYILGRAFRFLSTKPNGRRE